ncbi:MAG TPA: maleylpyruvate isomerase family mycothiol-dependent enzyme [Acidimicrobiia bacterium]|nr:maleylpyruvate isomerase family mycothiol-dependent enzyme [Acidimicrobiia bacterium]
MRMIVDALAAQHAELGTLLEGLDDLGWRRDTPCDGWDVAAVVLHLAQSDEIALASARGRFRERIDGLAGGDTARAASVEDGVEQLVAGERDSPPAEIHERWLVGAATLREELSSIDPHERVLWVIGDMAARTLATTRLAETWIHTRDVAVALEVELPPTDRLWHIARLAWRTLPYAFAREGRPMCGPVAFHLTAPDGAAWDFVPEDDAVHAITGDALDLCLVAARRVRPEQTSLRGEGPDAAVVLEIVRTWA